MKFLIVLTLICTFFIGCQKEISVPELKTREITEITDTSVLTGGTILSDGNSKITERGVCWSKNELPTINDNKTSEELANGYFWSKPSKLEYTTTYHLRAYAKNSAGVGYGNEIVFITLEGYPILTTAPISNITKISAQFSGNVISDGGSPIINRGFCIAESPNPTIENSSSNNSSGMGIFLDTFTNLKPNTTYYIRAYARNTTIDDNFGKIGYGNELSFKTAPATPDIDGVVYKTVIIGNQEWFAENLRTSRSNESAGNKLLATVQDNETFSYTTTAKYFYDSKKNIYGCLYNYYAVEYSNICPVGWRVPSGTDWQILIDYLGGEEVAGGKLKDKDTIFWKNPNIGADNSSGFTAIPAGGLIKLYRFGDFYYGRVNFGYSSMWWSKNEFDNNYANGFRIDNDAIKIERFNESNSYLFSVRCMRDKVE